MKILHLCLCGPFTDGMSYQENLMTKYHKLLGNEVYVITSQWSYDNKGNLKLEKSGSYCNNDGVNVIRIAIKNNNKLGYKFKKYPLLYYNIKNIKPDIIFIHGCQFIDIKSIVKYVKDNITRIYVDNHADFSNSATNFFSKKILHGIIWKHYAKMIEPYVTLFYGVLPARVDFLLDIYGLPKNKVKLLVMGCDDILALEKKKTNPRNKILKKFKFSDSNFLIITGGKIDLAKKQVLLLLKAINNINDKNIKVLVYGSVVEELREELLSLCSDNIKFVGWLNHDEIYEYILASDLAVYPGRHSVLWEETVGLGIPMIVKYWDGTTHIDVGGNVKFIMEDTIECIENVLNEAMKKENYNYMKKIAIQNGIKTFSYKEISKKAIEYNEGGKNI